MSDHPVGEPPFQFLVMQKILVGHLDDVPNIGDLERGCILDSFIMKMVEPDEHAAGRVLLEGRMGHLGFCQSWSEHGLPHIGALYHRHLLHLG